MDTHRHHSRSRLLRAARTLLVVLALVIYLMPLALTPTMVQADGGSYTIKWYAADPTSGYTRMPPEALTCPTGGRASEPLPNADSLDLVTSLAPQDMALGQVVPFEIEIKVQGAVTPEDGVIQFLGGWSTLTSSNRDFGYDPSWGVYCAFVDYGDPIYYDPEGDAQVDSANWAVVS
ncbi:MAG TPA: hypothetical protein VM366_02620, partial [Anaerolineae bacterium]|nr:hypothetical protein [Anaerolineae bacterium]